MNRTEDSVSILENVKENLPWQNLHSSEQAVLTDAAWSQLLPDAAPGLSTASRAQAPFWPPQAVLWAHNSHGDGQMWLWNCRPSGRAATLPHTSWEITQNTMSDGHT